MKCITSPALDDLQILGFMEGEANDSVVAHIQECPYCREKARRWTHLQNQLRKQFYRMTCPDPMELGEYHLDYLPDPQRLVIAQHLRECKLCQRELATLEDFLSNPVPEVDLLGGVKVLVARLLGTPAEGGLATAVPALRGEAKGPLTFEADGIVIVLDVQPAKDGKVNILGQVAADDQDQWTGALAEIRQGDQLQCSSTIDDLGAFRCEGIMTGRQELRIIPARGSPMVVSNFELVT